MQAGNRASSDRAWAAWCGILLTGALACFLLQPRHERSPAPVVRHFSATSLDGRCDGDGNLAPMGDPCADSRGYRFVLHREGRFDVYLVSEGSRRVLSGANGGFLWSGDRALDDGLLGAFESKGLGD